MKFLILILLVTCDVHMQSTTTFVVDFAKDFKFVNRVNYCSCPSKDNKKDWNKLNEEYTTFKYYNVEQLIQFEDMFDCKDQRELFVVELECPKIENLLELVRIKGGFKCNHWLLLGSNLTVNESAFDILSFMEETDLTIVSDVIFANPKPLNETDHKDGIRFYLYDFWNPGLSQGGTFRRELIAYYRVNDYYKGYFNKATDKPAIVRRLDMHEVSLKCAIVITKEIFEPFEEYLTHNYKPFLDTTHRLNYAIIRVVKDIFKFDLFVKRTNSWGYLLNDSSHFDGMIGMLQRREVDIGCSPAYFRLERLQAVDYGAQTWSVKPIFIFRHPNTRGLSGQNVFMVPFEDNVWIVTAISSIIIIVTFGRILKIETEIQNSDFVRFRRLIKYKNKNYIQQFLWSLKKYIKYIQKYLIESIMVFTRIMCQQGIENEESFTATRINLTNIFIFSSMIYQFYSASIVGSLLMEQPKTIKTIRGLINSPLKVGMEDLVINYDFFKHTTDQDALDLYEKKVKEVHKDQVSYNFFPVDVGLKRMQHERFAFHVDPDAVYYQILHSFDERDICDLQTIQLLPKQLMGNVVQKQSPFRKVINYGVRRAVDFGILSREQNTWITRPPKCTRAIQSEDLQVEFIPISSLYIFLLIAYAISLLILLIENIVYKRM